MQQRHLIRIEDTMEVEDEHVQQESLNAKSIAIDVPSTYSPNNTRSQKLKPSSQRYGTTAVAEAVGYQRWLIKEEEEMKEAEPSSDNADQVSVQNEKYENRSYYDEE